MSSRVDASTNDDANTHNNTTRIVETSIGPVDRERVVREIEAALADRDNPTPPTQQDVAAHAAAGGDHPQYWHCKRYRALGEWQTLLDEAGVVTFRERVLDAIEEFPETKTTVSAARLARMLGLVDGSRLGPVLSALANEEGTPIGGSLNPGSNDVHKWRIVR